MRDDRRAEEATHPPRRALRIDQSSRDVLVRFGFTLVLVVSWYLIWRDDSAVRLSVMALAACACVLAVTVSRREPVRAQTLTRWDEAAVWFAVACGAGALGM